VNKDKSVLASMPEGSSASVSAPCLTMYWVTVQLWVYKCIQEFMFLIPRIAKHPTSAAVIKGYNTQLVDEPGEGDPFLLVSHFCHPSASMKKCPVCLGVLTAWGLDVLWLSICRHDHKMLYAICCLAFCREGMPSKLPRASLLYTCAESLSSEAY
jgi:hypothetical protein